MTNPASDIDKAKKALRGTCAASRDALAPWVRAAASARLAEIGLGFAGAPAGAMVSAYMAMGSEIDPLPLVERLARDGLRTCLPVVQPLGNPLIFRAWEPGQPLVARTWGIREPADDAPIAEPDVLLAPLLAFDRRGVRLGYGGGYYDRTLTRLRAIKTVFAVGLAYDEQELADVPYGQHDQRLDWILRPAGPLKVG